MANNASLKINPAYVFNKSPHFVLVKPQKSKQSLPSINTLLEEHGTFVFKFIRKRTWDQQSCEDIYQSTMVEALKCFKNFRGESQPRTWLCGIAYNMIRNYSKGLSNHTTESLEDCKNIESYMDDSSFGTEDPSDIHWRNVQLEKIAKVFDELPKDMRITFEEVVSRGKSYEETALSLNLPIGTVRSRIARAREIFRDRSRYA